MAKVYCFKCEKKVDVKGASAFKGANGNKGIKGKCDKCGGKVAGFVKK